MQNRLFAQYLCYRNFKILTYYQIYCGFKIPLALILIKNPGFVKPSKNQ
ncbi:MAG TPA: hypothetical protein VKA34_12115 [Balneolales bacterium]|nr:hypothetical protein [Balneolales bacterium]